MADFRKWFLVAVILTVALGTANAQGPIACFNQGGVPPIVRAEGLAELVGDVLITCTGGTPGATFLVNWQIFLNTNVTSRLLTGASGAGSGASEALLMFNEPGPGAATVSPVGGCLVVAGCTFNTYRGQQGSANSIVWTGVPFTPPGTGTVVIRITNVRANANQLGVASTLLPQTIVMQISASGSQSLPIANFQATVAVIQSGMTFSISSCTGGGIATGANIFLQCASQNAGAAASNASAATTYQFGLKFRENFANAFKIRLAAGQDPSTPGTVYNTESGFVNTTSLGPESGFATQGTRVMATFNNVPAAVVLYVGTSGVYSGAAATSTTLTAVLVATDANGNGGSAATPVASTFTSATCGSSTGFAPLTISGGSGFAVWEITGASPFLTEQLVVPVAVAFVANTSNNLPGLGTSTVAGNFAPISTVTTASNSAPVPRFASSPVSASSFTINACVTNLLYPFVTNQAGFDTGLVVSNTSLDPFGTPTQSGSCLINYYGQTTGGGAAPAAQPTSVVPAGGQLVWNLSAGGSVPATPGFQGYIIAQCRFQFGHGFAFVSDVGAQKLAMGYLALVMDGAAATVPRTGSVSEPLAQ